MASIATKRRAENKSYKMKYKTFKKLEKGIPHKDVAYFSECQIITYRHGKRTNTQSSKNITEALFQKR